MNDNKTMAELKERLNEPVPTKRQLFMMALKRYWNSTRAAKAIKTIREG